MCIYIYILCTLYILYIYICLNVLHGSIAISIATPISTPRYMGDFAVHGAVEITSARWWSCWTWCWPSSWTSTPRPCESTRGYHGKTEWLGLPSSLVPWYLDLCQCQRKIRCKDVLSHMILESPKMSEAQGVDLQEGPKFTGKNLPSD